MKQLATILGFALALSLSTTVRAADKDEKEIKGEGLCLKCELKRADKCQTAIRVKEKDGKETVYILEENDVSKAFHKNVCTEVKKVIAKGTVKKDGDKNILVASKIELDEAKK
jgi:Family of unknown function (DUF6370)